MVCNCFVMETIRISVMVSNLFICFILFYFIFESDLTAFAFVGVSLLDKNV